MLNISGNVQTHYMTFRQSPKYPPFAKMIRDLNDCGIKYLEKMDDAMVQRLYDEYLGYMSHKTKTSGVIAPPISAGGHNMFSNTGIKNTIDPAIEEMKAFLEEQGIFTGRMTENEIIEKHSKLTRDLAIAQLKNHFLGKV